MTDWWEGDFEIQILEVGGAMLIRFRVALLAKIR